MKKQLLQPLPYLFFPIITLLLLFSVSLFATQDPTPANSGLSGGDIFEFLVITGYLLGVFVLLPWVIYTNTAEKLAGDEMGVSSDILPDPGLSEIERNSRAARILDEIAQKLTPFEEDGELLMTITKGSQARFMKKGIDYIREHLQPTDPDITDRMNELITVYQDRTQRLFTGSKWIIGCAVGMGIFFFWTGGMVVFALIHALGTAFYILSSRTPLYVLEKRMNLFGGGGAIVGAIFGAFFIGAAAKHYNIYSDGRKERDYSSEFTGGAVYFLFIAVAAMFLGFLVAALGVVNFLMNYMNNAVIPTKTQTWYEKNFSLDLPEETEPMEEMHV